VGKTCLYKTGLRKQGWEHRAEKTGLEKQVLKRSREAGLGTQGRKVLGTQGWAGTTGLGWKKR
jgi:hypothetical protein